MVLCVLRGLGVDLVSAPSLKYSRVPIMLPWLVAFLIRVIPCLSVADLEIRGPSVA
jgi:hypothetical protein